MAIRKILTVLTVFICITFFLISTVYADTLSLNITTNKEKIEIGEEMEINVSWDKPMQAADFFLNYDSDKLEYVKSDIDDVFVNNDISKGTLKTAWFSMDDISKTSIKYTFKVKKNGEFKFSTSINGGFATENMEIPNEYSEGNLVIKSQDSNFIIYIIVLIIIVINLIFLLIYLKSRKNKK